MFASVTQTILLALGLSCAAQSASIGLRQTSSVQAVPGTCESPPPSPLSQTTLAIDLANFSFEPWIILKLYEPTGAATYVVSSGDICDTIVRKHPQVGTFANLRLLNPVINSGCTNLYVDQTLCVLRAVDCPATSVVVS